MPAKTPITVAHSDSIGPEIMDATLQILDASGAALEIETTEIGEKVYLRGNTEEQTGIDRILALGRVSKAGIEIAATQTLRNFDGKAGFTPARGQ